MYSSPDRMTLKRNNSAMRGQTVTFSLMLENSQQARKQVNKPGPNIYVLFCHRLNT
jgi:hypothetical protein